MGIQIHDPHHAPAGRSLTIRLPAALYARLVAATQRWGKQTGLGDAVTVSVLARHLIDLGLSAYDQVPMPDQVLDP